MAHQDPPTFIRTAHFGLVIPQGSSPEAVEARQAVWRTHVFFNDVVRSNQETLLTMLQEACDVGGTLVTADEWRVRLHSIFRQQGVPEALWGVAAEACRELARAVLQTKNPGNAFTVSFYGKSNAKAVRGGPGAILKRLGFLPLPPVRQDVPKAGRPKFDQTAFSEAVQALKTHQTKTVQMSKVYSAAQEAYAASLAACPPDHLARVQVFEADRATSWESERSYRVLPGHLRGFDRLVKKLQKIPLDAPEARAAAVGEVQAAVQKKGRFGDAAVLSWLAAPTQADLLPHVEGIARCNGALSRLERMRMRPTFRLAHPVDSPRFLRFDLSPKSGGKSTNCPPYFLSERANPQASLSLLGASGFRLYTFQVSSHALYPGAQRVGGKLVHTNPLRGLPDLGQAKLLLSRDRAARSACAGELRGTARLSVPLAFPGGRSQDATAHPAWYYSTAPCNREAAKHPYHPGLRVLGVDLGIRSAFAWSVWREGKSPHPKALTLACPQAGIEAYHERSGLFKLSGEDPAPSVLRRREVAFSQRREIRQLVRHLADISRLYTAPFHRRAEILERLKEVPQGVHAVCADSLGALHEAHAVLGVSSEPPDATLQDSWERRVVDAYTHWEGYVGWRLGLWRKEVRQRAYTRGLGGESLWMVEHLDDVVRILSSWTHRSRPRQAGQPRARLSREERYIGSKLRDHTNRMKENRAKVIARCIANTALGLEQTSQGWKQVRDPVRVVVVEDLDKYTFSTDRPRKENRQLHRWSKQAIRKALDLALEGTGIICVTVDPRWTSRFDARSGQLGVRCHEVTEADARGIHNEGSEHFLWKWLDMPPELAPLVRVGDLLPTGTGEVLVTVGKESPRRVHADVNAAQNIAKRFFQGMGPHMALIAYPHEDGTFRTKPLGVQKASWHGVPPGSALVLSPQEDKSYTVESVDPVRRVRRGAKVTQTVEGDLDDGAALGYTVDEDGNPTGKPTRFILSGSKWRPEGEAIGMARSRIIRHLQNFNFLPYRGRK